jgi:hypothetical protein
MFDGLSHSGAPDLRLLVAEWSSLATADQRAIAELTTARYIDAYLGSDETGEAAERHPTFPKAHATEFAQLDASLPSDHMVVAILLDRGSSEPTALAVTRFYAVGVGEPLRSTVSSPTSRSTVYRLFEGLSYPSVSSLDTGDIFDCNVIESTRTVTAPKAVLADLVQSSDIFRLWYSDLRAGLLPALFSSAFQAARAFNPDWKAIIFTAPCPVLRLYKRLGFAPLPLFDRTLRLTRYATRDSPFKDSFAGWHTYFPGKPVARDAPFRFVGCQYPPFLLPYLILNESSFIRTLDILAGAAARVLAMCTQTCSSNGSYI